MMELQNNLTKYRNTQYEPTLLFTAKKLVLGKQEKMNPYLQ